MPDPRFYEDLGPASLAELSALAGAELADPLAGERIVRQVATLERASPDSLTFLSDRRYAPQLAEGKAGACFVSPKDAALVPPGCIALLTRSAPAAYAAAAQRLHRPRRLAPGQALAPDARLEEGVSIGFGAVIGAGAQIGRGTVIGPGAVIGPGVAIGRDSVIGANAVLTCTLVGDRVQILAGAVIGEAGFGAAAGPAGLVDMPQLGRVIIQDGVSIGANTCIDRGAYDDTVIGENTKIDNLVQIAHNVRVGRNCVMAAHTGISGSVVIGDGAMFGGRAGVIDHIQIGQGARIAAGAAVMKDVPAGESWGGAPAKPLRRWMRESAWVAMMAHRRKEGAEP